MIKQVIACMAAFCVADAVAYGGEACPASRVPLKVSPVVHHATTKEPGDLVAVAAGNDDFSTLVAAVKAAGLVETLQGKGPFTVFAPTNEAFAKLPKGTVEELLKPESKEKLTQILLYHVVPGKVTAAEVVKLKEAKTASKKTLAVKVEDGKVMINGACVVKTDVAASNGVIHVIDAVLLPKE